MSLSSSLNIALSGLNATQNAMSVSSQNVANANATGYVAELANVQSRDTNGVGSGVAVARTTLASNAPLQNAVWSQNAKVGALTVQNAALSALASVQGSTSADSGASDTLSDRLGNVQSALIALTATPSDSAAQRTVVTDAQQLVTTIHTLAETYQTQRQGAQDGIVSDVASANTNLTTIGSLSTQIMKLQAQGLSTADLENQRNIAVSNLSSVLSIKTQVSSTGDMTVTTEGGLPLPTHNRVENGQEKVSDSWPLSTSSAVVTAKDVYTGPGNDHSLPGISLNGRDVTSLMQGGSLGGNLVLRDAIFPQMQAQLDSFTDTLTNRLGAAGMSLFTGISGNPAASANKTYPDGLVGYAQNLQVASSYVRDPSLLVKGTAYDTSVIQNVLNNGFAALPSTEPTEATTKLGLNGKASLGYAATQGLVSLATSLTASQADVISTISDRQATAQAVQSSLGSKLSAMTGVNVDTEMANITTLQKAYAANAKVISVVQSMFQTFLDAV